MLEKRQAWFRQLADPVKRKPEDWIIDGLAELHHPLRAEVSAALVQPALDMLLNVRRHGGTFFDSVWVASVLRGHGSLAGRASLSGRIDARLSSQAA